ncbi:MAG: mannose-1-phosphate guanylyltransferase/mannose-6-phosphate isomerase [Pelagibacterales bacterium]|nr:mannose-1-phosphate guanylyltransferase/mannose-6-phosphate isomerase [Pelagibacterales bacterium]
MKITPVILSGGSGTRLWPLSRSLNPKQFLDFLGKNSLFQKAALRVRNDLNFNNPIIVCNNEHRFITAEELQNVGIKPKSIILEPVGRNTAPAVAIAALNVDLGDEDIILVMPSDHIILEEEKFINHVQKAIKAATEGYLVTFGIIPDRAETGYGYIKQGKKIGLDEALTVDKFIEKPQKETATKFLQDGGYLWNSGIFMFKASTYLEILQELQPEIFEYCMNSYENSAKDLDFVRLEKDNFERCPNISIDYAVMEKAKKVAVVPIEVGWSDVGNWQAISDISEKNAEGNSLIGDVISLKTKNSYINSRNGLVATIGVEDLIVITLKDATLIAHKNNAQDVKDVVDILKNNKREECNSSPKTLRPWGSFETIDLGDRFKVKRITVKSGASLSLQMHHHRAEHWVVVRGEAVVTCDDKEFVLNEDQSTYIPIGKKHRLENRGNSVLEIIEVQTGSYLGEDDIVRFSDIYGR